jgi:hypothetical protein
MCWMALIPLVAGVAGGMMQGNAQEQQALDASRDARMNAMFANDAANDAYERGLRDADLQRLRTAQMLGQQRVAAAANGGDVNEGSNSVLQEDTAMLGELDALTLDNNAAREAYGYKVQAISGFTNSRNILQNGQEAKRQSILGGVINGIGGAMSSGGFSGASGSGSMGTGTAAAIQGTSRLNYNQAYA